MKTKDYISQTVDMFKPAPKQRPHPRCGHVGAALAAQSDYGVSIGPLLSKRGAGTVPDPVGVPAIQADGSVQPSASPAEVRRSANPINSLNPVLAPVAAPTAVSEWHIKPQSALPPAPRPQGIGGYAPGVSA